MFTPCVTTLGRVFQAEVGHGQRLCGKEVLGVAQSEWKQHKEPTMEGTGCGRIL